MTQKLLCLFTVLVMMVTSACTTDQRIATLEGVIDSLEVLLPVLEAANPQNAPIYAMIDSAIAGLPTALQETQTEMASLDTDAIKAAKIAIYFAPCVASIQALPPVAQAITVGVAKAIQTFLNSLAPYNSNLRIKQSYYAGTKKSYSLPTKYQTKIADISGRVGKLPITPK